MMRPDALKDVFYRDIDDETIAELAKDLRPQSLGSFWSTTTHAAWRDIPTTYILCTKDKPTTVGFARRLVDAAKSNGKRKIDMVIEVDARHCPVISRPNWVAETIIAEAGRLFV